MDSVDALMDGWVLSATKVMLHPHTKPSKHYLNIITIKINSLQFVQRVTTALTAWNIAR